MLTLIHPSGMNQGKVCAPLELIDSNDMNSARFLKWAKEEFVGRSFRLAMMKAFDDTLQIDSGFTACLAIWMGLCKQRVSRNRLHPAQRDPSDAERYSIDL